MPNLYVERAKDVSPEVAYKFIINSKKMTDEALAAIDKCLRAGIAPEQIAEAVSEKQELPSEDADKKPAMHIFFVKALEHRKWLLDLGVFDKEAHS